jgi:hypothetical protein
MLAFLLLCRLVSLFLVCCASWSWLDLWFARVVVFSSLTCCFWLNARIGLCSVRVLLSGLPLGFPCWVSIYPSFLLCWNGWCCIVVAPWSVINVPATQGSLLLCMSIGCAVCSQRQLATFYVARVTWLMISSVGWRLFDLSTSLHSVWEVCCCIVPSPLIGSLFCWLIPIAYCWNGLGLMVFIVDGGCLSRCLSLAWVSIGSLPTVYLVLGVAALMHFICYLVVCLVLLACMLADMLLQVSTSCWLGSLWSRLLHWCCCSLSCVPILG